MAEKENENKQEKTDEKPSGSNRQWIILAAIIILCTAAGAGFSKFLAAGSATSGQEQKEKAPKEESAKQEEQITPETPETWYYPLAPVLANLDVPGATRFIRVAVTLELDKSLSETQGKALIDAKTPVLVNWLTIHLSGLGLEEVRGEKNLKRIQTQILDAFNDELFPNSKSTIKSILLKEFSIQ